MKDIIDKDFYKQDFSVLNPVIGMDLKSLHFERGSVSLNQEQILSGNGELIVTFSNKEKGDNYRIAFASKGRDSAGGDIYGFEFSHILKEEKLQSCFGKVLYPQNYKVESLTFYGEEKEEEIVDVEVINFFYYKLKEKPNKVIVKKKTIDIIRFKISNYKNCYLYSNGERDFHLSLDFPLNHEAWLILQKDSYRAMGKELKELKKID